MTGFVTLAVGDERYYKLAANLLLSHRLNGNSDAPFAIFADRKNQYTAMFDQVILLDTPHLSYLDKLEMLQQPPFEHNIFIDADCLIYNDVSLLLQSAGRGGVYCFGRALPITSTEGWFLLEDIGEYKEQICFIPSMHGGIIFFSQDELTKKIYRLSMKISSEYSSYRFKYFDKPADEPILALASAVCDCPPVELHAEEIGAAFCFLPTVKVQKMNIRKRQLVYTDGTGVRGGGTTVLHWQNHYTKQPVYGREVDRISMSEPRVMCRFILRYIGYHVHSFCARCLGWLKRHMVRR